jgi:hypothetical protein
MKIERGSLEELQFMQWLKDDSGIINPRPIRKYEWAGLFQYMFTCAIVTGRVGDKTSFEDRWCYHSKEAAMKAFIEWNGEGEPNGWHRHPHTGRRRTDGDPATEYVSI